MILAVAAEINRLAIVVHAIILQFRPRSRRGGRDGRRGGEGVIPVPVPVWFCTLECRDRRHDHDDDCNLHGPLITRTVFTRVSVRFRRNFRRNIRPDLIRRRCESRGIHCDYYQSVYRNRFHVSTLTRSLDGDNDAQRCSFNFNVTSISSPFLRGCTQTSVIDPMRSLFLLQIFTRFGKVLKIVTFTKNSKYNSVRYNGVAVSSLRFRIDGRERRPRDGPHLSDGRITQIPHSLADTRHGTLVL